MLSNLQLVLESGDVCLFQKAVKKEVVSVRMHLIQVDIDHIQKTAKGREGRNRCKKKKNSDKHLGCQQRDRESDTERQTDRRGSMPSLTNVQTTVHQYDNEQVV